MNKVSMTALNSATKYPSIETFHKLDGRGTLTEEHTFQFEGTVLFKEKVDGTNIRVVRMPGDDFYIGTREHLVYAKGDRLAHPVVEEIVRHVRPVAESLSPKGSNDEWIEAYFMEVYGGKVSSGSKQYTGRGAVGHRLFDIALVPAEVLAWDIETISSWRKGGGQTFLTDPHLRRAADDDGLELVPALGQVPADVVNSWTREQMQEVLRSAAPATRAALDEHGKGGAEGIVLRTYDRRFIAKARFADYRKALDPQGRRR